MAPGDPSGHRQGAQASMSVALGPTPPLINLASASEVHSEALDHADPSSTQSALRPAWRRSGYWACSHSAHLTDDDHEHQRYEDSCHY